MRTVKISALIFTTFISTAALADEGNMVGNPADYNGGKTSTAVAKLAFPRPDFDTLETMTCGDLIRAVSSGADFKLLITSIDRVEGKVMLGKGMTLLNVATFGMATPAAVGNAMDTEVWLTYRLWAAYNTRAAQLLPVRCGQAPTHVVAEAAK